MKIFAVDFAFYEFDNLVFTIKWISAKTERNATTQLIKHYGNVHINDIRELRL